MPNAGARCNTVAVVSQNVALRRQLHAWLAQERIVVVDLESTQTLLTTRPSFGLACVDASLPDLANDSLVRRLHALKPSLPVILISADGPPSQDGHRTLLGALDHLTLPLDAGRLLRVVQGILGRHTIHRSYDHIAPITLAGPDRGEPSLLGDSEPMQLLRQQIHRVAQSDIPVCITGESGSGKELVARALHRLSGRRGPFVALNCAAIPSTLQDAELFGYERGAFTGAVRQHKGRFEEAEGGTLFLDEVGEMAPATQALLLRTLQEKVIRRVGGMSDIAVNVRVLSATHRDLGAEVRAAHFRQDLYFRLVVYPIQVPPLRDRPGDLPQLVLHMVRRFSSQLGPPVTHIAEAALDALGRYAWPGNVRELENIIRRALLNCDDSELSLRHLPIELRRGDAPQAPDPVPKGVEAGRILPLHEVERRAIVEALKVTAGNVSAAAKLLQVGRATLYRRLQQLGLSPESDGDPPPTDAARTGTRSD